MNPGPLVLSLLFMLSLPGMTQAPCELKKDKDGIKIYNCESTGSVFKDIRAEFEVNATIEKYISVVLDINSYKDWRYREFNHRVLLRISGTELIYYAQVSAPFPVNNRDLVLHLTLHQDPVTKILTSTIESMPDYLPPVDKVVRVPRSKSIMTLTPVGDSKLKVSCFVQIDPGGQVPAWLVNTFSTQGPYETFSNLIRKMEAK